MTAHPFDIAVASLVATMGAIFIGWIAGEVLSAWLNARSRRNRYVSRAPVDDDRDILKKHWDIVNRGRK